MCVSRTASRRTAHLPRYIARRRDKIDTLEARLTYLDTVVADKSAPRDVRRRARDDHSMTDSNLRALRREPSDEQLRARDMCPDAAFAKLSRLRLDRRETGVAQAAADPCQRAPAARRPGQTTS